MTEQTDLQPLVSELAEVLLKKDKSLVTAESCTGGWVAKVCTDMPGSSQWFRCGFVTYSNESKQQLLGVDADTLHSYGAVSQQTAQEMALGALSHSDADYSVALTGIAGPEGGSEAKPVGTVWIGWGIKGSPVTTHCFQFQGDRESIRKQAVIEALKGIIKNARDS